MSQRPKQKSWQAENPDKRLVPPGPSKGADEEVFYLRAADFWQTVLLSKVTGGVAETKSNCWWWLYSAAQTSFCHRANCTNWGLSSCSHLHPNQLVIGSSAIWREAWIDKGLARSTASFAYLDFNREEVANQGWWGCELNCTAFETS